MKQPLTIFKISIDNETYDIKVYGNVDKCTDFIYYTFEFNNENKIVISKFDGNEWKISNQLSNNKLAILLGRIIDNLSIK